MKNKLVFDQGYGIIETDNFGGDYPNEKFVGNLPHIREEKQAEEIAKAINACTGGNHPRYWRAVKLPYKLQPGFEP